MDAWTVIEKVVERDIHDRALFTEWVIVFFYSRSGQLFLSTM